MARSLVVGKLQIYRVGDLVKGEVSQVGEDYIYLKLEDGLEARASGSLATGNVRYVETPL